MAANWGSRYLMKITMFDLDSNQSVHAGLQIRCSDRTLYMVCLKFKSLYLNFFLNLKQNFTAHISSIKSN